jgi:hypothetical protein
MRQLETRSGCCPATGAVPPSVTRIGLSRPLAKEQPPSFWPRFGFLIADPATWRDLVWITVDTLVGWLLTLTPAGLIAWGLFGVVSPPSGTDRHRTRQQLVCLHPCDHR